MITVLDNGRIVVKSQGELFGPRKPVQAPGSRGGKFYQSEKGDVRYGQKPAANPPAAASDETARNLSRWKTNPAEPSEEELHHLANGPHTAETARAWSKKHGGATKEHAVLGGWRGLAGRLNKEHAERSGDAVADHKKADGQPCHLPLSQCPLHGKGKPQHPEGIMHAGVGGYPEWMKDTRNPKGS